MGAWQESLVGVLVALFSASAAASVARRRRPVGACSVGCARRGSSHLASGDSGFPEWEVWVQALHYMMCILCELQTHVF